MDFMSSLRTFDGDNGMEDDVPPAEVTLTERSVESLDWVFNIGRIPILEVDDVDAPGGDVELDDEDGPDEGMKLNVTVVQER